MINFEVNGEYFPRTPHLKIIKCSLYVFQAKLADIYIKILMHDYLVPLNNTARLAITAIISNLPRSIMTVIIIFCDASMSA